METLLDILAYVGIALLAWFVIMLVWVALRFAFSDKPFYKEWRKEVDEENERKEMGRRRKSTYRWWKDIDHPNWPDSLKRVHGIKV